MAGVDAVAVHELLSVRSRVYVPLMAVVAFRIFGLACALLNPGPDHEYP
jgi:hypothetical protein